MSHLSPEVFARSTSQKLSGWPSSGAADSWNWQLTVATVVVAWDCRQCRWLNVGQPLGFPAQADRTPALCAKCDKVAERSLPLIAPNHDTVAAIGGLTLCVDAPGGPEVPQPAATTPTASPTANPAIRART